MKQLGFLFTLSALLLMNSCGDDDDSSAGPDNTVSFASSDVAAVRAILDANGLTDVLENQVARYELVNGQYRYFELGLVNEVGYFGEGAGVVIDTIPPEIGQLTYLRSLRFGDMAVRSLPAEIGNLSRLTTLVASNNELTALPVELFNLSALLTLRVEGNAIGLLSGEVSNLSSLRNLQIQSNELTQLPATLTSMSSLQNIVFDDNKICTMSSELQTWLQQFGYSANWQTETAQRCGG